MTLVNQTGCLYDNGDKSTADPKYENMKHDQLFTKLVLSQAAEQKPFDYEAEEARIQEKLSHLDLEKMFNIKKEEPIE